MRPCLLLPLLLMTGLGYAQLPNVSFETITDRDGLPSRMVECAAEDTSGFIWFGTRHGLTRYDGYSFRRISDKITHGVATDPSGHLYASEGEQRLLKINLGTLTSKPVSTTIEGGGRHTFIDSFGNVWFSDWESVNRYDPVTGRTFRYPIKKTTYIFHKGSFAEDSQRRVWVLGMEVGLFVFDRAANRLICKLGLDCPQPGIATYTEFWSGFIDKNDQLWAAVIPRGLMRYDLRTDRVKFFPYKDRGMLCVTEGTDPSGRRIFWVGTSKGLGIFRPDTEQFAFFDNLFPPPYEVIDIRRSSRTGIVWVCTSAGILKYDPHNQFVKTNRIAARQPVNAFLTDRRDPTGKTVWLAVPYVGLYRWNRSTNVTTLFPFPQYAGLSEATWLQQDRTGRLWVGCNQWQAHQDGVGNAADNRFEGIFCFDPQAERYVSTPISVHHTFFSVPFYSLGLFDRRGRLWLANHYESLHVVDPKTNRDISPWLAKAHAELFKNGAWLMRVFEDRSGRMWLATTRGLFWFDEPARTFRKAGTDASILDIAQGRDGALWVVAWQMVLNIDPATGRLLKRWTTTDGLYDIECRRVTVDAAGCVWIGTFDGLHRFNPRTNTFRRFTVNDGLLTNSTLSSLLLADANNLLVGNLGGWNALDLAQLDRSGMGTDVRLTDVRVNNHLHPADWSLPVTLEADETAISFDFAALNYRKATDNQYRFYLEGLDTDWGDSTTVHQAFYTNLAPRDYVFHARLTGPGAGRALRIPFRVRPRFFETWWFRLLALLAVAGVLTAFYQNRLSYRTIKTRLELEEALARQQDARYQQEVSAYQLKLSETEMTALRAQMNPHFIFNCLNSIQFFTAQNDSERASDYLTKFARLIRLVLENSRSAKVTLANELETVRLYIEMEAMRFPQKLHYVIETDDDIDPETVQIPPLLLQPFVENAIWHGLMHKEEGGTVQILVQQLQLDRLHVDITDDGVGRAKAAEYKSKSATRHKSFGMKMTAERIDLINQLYQIQTEVRVTDLTDNQGQPIGTRVVIEIPV